MPKEKHKFVNPLTQPTTTETETEPDTQMPTQTETAASTQSQVETDTHPSTQASSLPPTQTDTETPTQVDTYTSSDYIPRKRGREAFERTHERYTFWIEKKLRKRLEALAKKEDAAKTTLLNEAIAKLLKERE